MNAEPVVIDRSLVAGEFMFATHRDRCLYLGKSVRDRAQWLKDNADRWRRIRDVQQEADSLRRRVDSEIPIDAIAAGPSSHSSCRDVRNDGEVDGAASSTDIPAGDPAPPPSPTTVLPTTVAPSPSSVEIAIGGRRYVSAQCLASMLGISLRTLSRRCAGCNGPPKMKIGGKVYFELGNIPEWVASRQIPIKPGH
jgi:hypothetical protein